MKNCKEIPWVVIEHLETETALEALFKKYKEKILIIYTPRGMVCIELSNKVSCKVILTGTYFGELFSYSRTHKIKDVLKYIVNNPSKPSLDLINYITCLNEKL